MANKNRPREACNKHWVCESAAKQTLVSFAVVINKRSVIYNKDGKKNHDVLDIPAKQISARSKIHEWGKAMP